MSKKTSTQTEPIYVFTTMEADSEDWDPVKIDSDLMRQNVYIILTPLNPAFI